MASVFATARCPRSRCALCSRSRCALCPRSRCARNGARLGRGDGRGIRAGGAFCLGTAGAGCRAGAFRRVEHAGAAGTARPGCGRHAPFGRADDYFRDALFIGDSVTQGFGVYPEYKDWMRVCAYKGIGPQNVLQNMVGQRPDNTPIEMWDDIKTQQGVANIYVLFGANALLAQSDEAFLKYYGDLLDLLRGHFPNVPIYVQSLTPTTQAYGQRRPALARDHLCAVNEAVAQMAASRGMYYVDLWEALADTEGYLREELSGDGLHLHDGGKYRPWLDYLASHTVYSAHNAQFVLADGGAYS